MPDLSECTAFSLTSWLNVPTMHILHPWNLPRKSSMSRGSECHQNISKPAKRPTDPRFAELWPRLYKHINLSGVINWQDNAKQQTKLEFNSKCMEYDMNSYEPKSSCLRDKSLKPVQLHQHKLISTSHSDLRGVAAPWLRPECEIWWWRHAFVSSNVQAVVENWKQNIIENPFECNN